MSPWDGLGATKKAIFFFICTKITLTFKKQFLVRGCWWLLLKGEGRTEVRMEEEEVAGLRRADPWTAGRTGVILGQTQPFVKDLELEGLSKPH